ncbi:uncharacterized protein LOC111325294 isoform X2 [Stylophora pistillata]|uniref:uncharacterized protein LOC111325294 isoform X2 n=2 Tax=Stylophora pistillata TaxID=50429 RepID=UPI000C0469DC|nr:uncharacterized protein LOC111325294 isoform X2 [Stylophora pistillata]
METPSSSSKVMCTGTKEKFGFQVDFSWGVGSLRQCAGFPARFLNREDENCYVAPLGSLVLCWNVATMQRKYSFQAHSDLITVMLYNSHLNATLTACYTGEIKLWSPNWELFLSCNATVGEVHFADWSTNGDRILLCGEDIQLHSVVIAFDLVKQHEKWEIREKWTVTPKTPESIQSSSSSFQEENASGYLIEAPASVINEGKPSSTYVKQKDFYDMAVFTSQNNVIALLQRHHNHFSEAHLFSESGKFLKSQTLDPLGDSKASLMCLSPCHNGIIAVGFQGGIFLLLCEADLSITSFLQATGSAQAALWHGDYLLAVSYLSGIFSWWTIRGELVHEIRGGPTNSIIHLNWAVPGRALWVGGIMSLHYISLDYINPGDKFPQHLKQVHDIKFLEVTGCGVAMNEKNLVLAGDFTGNIFIWQKGKTDPVFKTKHESSIRCLTWNNDYAFIGCLDGDLLRWLPSGDVPPCTALTCLGGILTMAWSHDCTSLAIGLDSGHLCLYLFQPVHSSQPEELLNFRAHFIEREGQEVAAEIWSVCWSPCASMIATASEDQTACIWNSSNETTTERVKKYSCYKCEIYDTMPVQKYCYT